MKSSLQPGASFTARYTVDKDRTIDFMGEELRVYSTPSMLEDIEHTCRDLILEHLDDGEDTVGVSVELKHLGATLLGMWVEVSATITGVDDRQVNLEATVVDQAGQTVGKATHGRFVVDVERQRQRLAKMAEKLESGG